MYGCILIACHSYSNGVGASMHHVGHTPSTAGTFRKKFQFSGKTPETLSEHFLEFPSRVRLGSPKPYDSRHLRRPEHLQNSLPPSTAGDASFFRSGSREGLSEPVMEFPAVLGAFLIMVVNTQKNSFVCAPLHLQWLASSTNSKFVMFGPTNFKCFCFARAAIENGPRPF